MFCNPYLVTGVFVSPFSSVVIALISLEKTSTSEVSGSTLNIPGFTVKFTTVDLTRSPLTLSLLIAKIGIS